MLFNSFDFAVFFPIFFLLYWLVAKQITLRNSLILGGSYLFYGWWDWQFLGLIIFSSLVDFIVGNQIHIASSKKNKKLLLLISLCANLGLLIYFKYTNFFIESFIDSFRLFGGSIDSFSLQIILPVGISFYTFQTLSYTIDIYKGKLQPTKNTLAFFSFVAFFPQLVAGPIERASHLLPQFYKTYRFNYQSVKSGLLLMLFGLFKKMVIADRLAIVVNEVYNNPAEHTGITIIIATIFFAFQIYCDFSGYSDIAIGLSRTLGFDLMQNFRSPYFSKSITEFWRRWHISLSTWFRDYVYIPLGGSKKGEYRTYVNLFLVFVISGLWHGAAVTFIIWGIIHGVIIVIEKATHSKRLLLLSKLKLTRETRIGQLFLSMTTFSIVCFAWIFFRANDTQEAFTIIKNSFNFKLSKLNLFKIGLPEPEIYLAFITIILLLVFEKIHLIKSAVTRLNNQYLLLRWSFYVTAIFVIIIFGKYGNGVAKEFIYFQF